MPPPAPGWFSVTTGWFQILLSRSARTREVESFAEPAAESTTNPISTDDALAKLKALDFGIGWDATVEADDSRHLPANVQEVLPAVGANLLGWLFAIAAVSMGAPFWFDLLKNVVNLRGAGAPVDGASKKQKKARDDARAKKP